MKNRLMQRLTKIVQPPRDVPIPGIVDGLLEGGMPQLLRSSRLQIEHLEQGR